MKCLFIYNPISGRNKKLMKRLGYIENKLKEKYDVVDIVPTEYAGHTIKLAREACGKYDTLLFSGGDGTFSEVVKGIGENKNPPCLGFIPSGTVSDMANNYNIPRNIKKAINLCLNGHKEKIDICKINDSYFIYAGALGTYTDATFTTSVKLKKKYGRMAYFMNGAKEAFKVEEQNLKMVVGKKKYFEKSLLVLILNTRSIGGFPNFNYTNRFGDGKFDVVVVKEPLLKTPVNIWRLFVRGVYSFIDNPDFLIFTTNKIEMEVDKEVDWNLDGDAYKAKKVTIECLKKKLWLFVPEK